MLRMLMMEVHLDCKSHVIVSIAKILQRTDETTLMVPLPFLNGLLAQMAQRHGSKDRSGFRIRTTILAYQQALLVPG